jgi:hypothetical protein
MVLQPARKYGVYFLVGLCCVLTTSASFAIELQCPASVDVSEKLVNEPSPWEAVIDQGRGGYHLDKVGFYSGHPKNKGAVVPDKATRSKGLAKTTWYFPQKKSDNFWISCSYANTAIMLTQQLPDGLSYCEVASELLPSGSVLRIKSIVCK